MKILFAFYNHPELAMIQRSLLKAFKEKGHDVITCGVPTNGLKLDLAYRTPSVSLLKLLDKVEKKPDLLFLCWPSVNFILTDIEKAPIPTAVYLVDTHLPLMRACVKGYALLFDYIFCAQKDCYEELRKVKDSVFWCPFAADPAIHRPIDLFPQYDIVFAGVTNPLHNPRRSFYLSVMKRFFTVKTGKAYGNKLTHCLAQGKTLFNIPVTNDLNARIFETIACKRLLFAPLYQHGLTDLFVNQKHFVGYKNLIDLLIQIKFYLKHKTEMERIARLGQQHVFTHHLYKNRVDYILSIIKNAQYKPANDILPALRYRSRRGIPSGFPKEDVFSASIHPRLKRRGVLEASNKTISPEKYIAIAVSYYLLCSVEAGTYWLIRLLKQRNISYVKRLSVRLCLSIIVWGGQALRHHIFRLASHFSALKIILWQLTHL